MSHADEVITDVNRRRVLTRAHEDSFTIAWDYPGRTLLEVRILRSSEGPAASSDDGRDEGQELVYQDVTGSFRDTGLPAGRSRTSTPSSRGTPATSGCAGGSTRDERQARPSCSACCWRSPRWWACPPPRSPPATAATSPATPTRRRRPIPALEAATAAALADPERRRRAGRQGRRPRARRPVGRLGRPARRLPARVSLGRRARHRRRPGVAAPPLGRGHARAALRQHAVPHQGERA